MELLREKEFISYPCFHEVKITSKMTDLQKDYAIRANNNLEKYRQDVDSFINSYYGWMEEHLAPLDKRTNVYEICVEQITSKDAINKEDIQFYSQIIAEDLETVRFYNSALYGYLDEINKLVSSKVKTQEEKSIELQRLYYLYDIARVSGFDFYRATKEKEKTKIYYIDKKGIEVDYDACWNELYDLTFPDDYRACQMFLDMHRLGLDQFEDENGLFKAHWGFYFCYQYITRIFSLGHFTGTSLDVDFFPRRLLQDMKFPFKTTIRDTQRGLAKALRQLKKYHNSIDHEIYDKYRLTTHEIILAPIPQNIARAGIFPATSKEEEVRNMIFALGRSLDAVDLICDYLEHILNYDDPILQDNKEIIDCYYNDLKNMRSEIVYYTYTNERQYSTAHKDYVLETIKSGEILTKKNIDDQLRNCDRFRRICQMASISTLDLLMEEKRKISEEFREYEKESSVSKYVIGRLNDLLEEVSIQVQNELEERNLTLDYREKIKNFILTYGDCNVAELPGGFVQLLSSAEYLYSQYISEREENKELDYSFVAILYYKALENLIDSKFYSPYITPIKGREIEEEEFSYYFKQSSYKYIVKSKIIAEHLELGSFSIILSAKKYPLKMEEFIKGNFISGAEEKLKKIGALLSVVKDRRNKAAHGTSVVEYNDALIARSDTFDADWEADVITCKGVIIDFLHLLR